MLTDEHRERAIACAQGWYDATLRTTRARIEPKRGKEREHIPDEKLGPLVPSAPGQPNPLWNPDGEQRVYATETKRGQHGGGHAPGGKGIDWRTLVGTRPAGSGDDPAVRHMQGIMMRLDMIDHQAREAVELVCAGYSQRDIQRRWGVKDRGIVRCAYESGLLWISGCIRLRPNWSQS